MKKSEFFTSTNSSRVFPFFFFLLCCAGQLSAATWYVKPTGNDANNGNSWATAYQTLTKALQSAASGDQIWVAAGTYKPTTGTDRTISFNMKNGVAILGGFPASGSPVLADRDWETHVTTLSGDIGTAGDNSDNSYHVVYSASLNNTAILDGFVVTGGNADGPQPHDHGGGLKNASSSPTIQYCSFYGNSAVSGGGVSNVINSSAIFNHCNFSNNSATSGGGMYNYISAPTVKNCSFSGNSGLSGGAAFNHTNGAPKFINCVFYSNTGASNGSAVSTTFSSVTLANCSFSGNSGGGTTITSLSSTATITNCNIWGNNNSIVDINGTTTVSYSNVQGGYTGTGNSNVNPLFVNAPADLRLQACSPVINKGSDAAVPAGITTDFDDNNRFFGTVDMGAYEYQGNPPGLAAICKNITIELDATGNISIPASAVDNGSTGCNLSMYLSKTSFNCSNVGANNLLFVVSDNNFHSSSCAVTVTVQDNTVPTAVCKNATVQLDATGNVTVPALAVDNGSTATCGIAALTLSKSNFNCSNIGNSLVSLEVQDNKGNKAYCSTTITVQDIIAPVALCKNATVQLDATGNATLTPAAINNGSADACGIASLALSKTTFNCTNVGANTITLTVTDNNGKAAACTATVTVQDNTLPTAVCKNATVQLDATGSATLVPAAINNGSTDACGTSTLTLSKTNFNCSNVGANTVTLTVTDGSNNASTCSATVTVQDNTLPTAVCKNVTVQLDATGNVTVPGSAVDNGSSDVCGIAALTLSKTNFNCSNVGSLLVSLEVRDNNGNKAYCSSTLTVQDNVAPTAVCQNTTLQLDATGNATLAASAINNGSADVCGITSLSLSKTAFDCTNIGANTVTLTVTDNNGKTAACTAIVTVQDNIAPTAVCQNITVQLDASGNATVTATAVNNGSNDGCGIASLSLSKTTFDCSNIGANTVTLTATDNNGKTASCSAAVTVQDNTAPTLICPQNITVAPDPNSPCTAFVDEGLESTVDDNCTTSLTYQFSGALTGSGVSQVPATTFPNGVTTITYTVTDGGQNSAQCAFQVTVVSCGIAVSGKLIWENDDASGVGNALVNLGGDESGSVTTSTDGLFSFSVEQGADLVLTPAKTINKLNGVTAADATRIQQHVANINLITDPYKLVAADVNKTNSVTTLDASIINQALLGNPAALAQFKTSWRFVPVSYNLSLPPWGFPENITLEYVQGNMPEQNFFGIKTGDVLAPFTNPANLNGSAASKFTFNTADQALQFGEQITVAFSADQFSNLAALQFALKFDVEKLALAGIEPLGGLPVSEENFGTYNVSEGAINVVWSQAEGMLVEEAAPVFQLTFNVLETGGKLSEALYLADELLESHAYTSTLTDNKVNLQFFGTTGTGDPAIAPRVELLQNRPNPFSGTTTISFVLPQGCEAQLRVFDASGRVLLSQQKNYPAGRQDEVLDLEGASGVLWYELTTPWGILTKKMVAGSR